MYIWAPFSSVGRAGVSAVDLGSTPDLGPFAACHSPSLSLFPVTLFSCTINKAIKTPKKILKEEIHIFKVSKEQNHSMPPHLISHQLNLYVENNETFEKEI